jgi:ribonucleoside-diphosphate reductase alpha subunit
MRVTKRDGRLEDVSFDKVLRRIKILSKNLNVDATIVAQKVCGRIYDKVSTSELDELAARMCYTMSTEIPDYGTLASRIIISNNHKNTPDTFVECIERLNGIKIIDKNIYNFILENKNTLNNEKDYTFSWFSFKTLERSYLLKVDGVTTERIQYMFMRVSCGIHYPDIEEVIKSYRGMSNKFFTHATPTLFNAGTIRPQLLSCFLTKPHDSIPGIYKWISDLAKISKEAGGIGGTVTSIRGKGAYIQGSNSYSSGIIPMLRVVNETMKYVNQGGRRAGSCAIYLEPHHPDIMNFLELRLNHGNEDDRARDLFTAIWASDLFMERVRDDKEWSLLDPKTCPGLDDVYGDDYRNLYEKYEREGKAKKVIKAQDVWKAITKSQIETGTPYMNFKDHINRKSNQKHYGTIKASNLCSEITEYHDEKEYACCCLSSICLPKFVRPVDLSNDRIVIYTIDNCNYCKLAKMLLKDFKYEEINQTKLKHFKTYPQIVINDNPIGGYTKLKEILTPKYDFKMLEDVAGQVVRNLNKVIGVNLYPVPETRYSNFKHRPLGIGVQGLADVFCMFRFPFDSEEALALNNQIFETIYYGAMKSTIEEAKKYGAYETFRGSPLSQGLFQFDLWGKQPSDRYDWNSLRIDVMKYGARNSLLIACMPTASTSQICGNNETIEPYTSNMYVRTTMSGEFIVSNKHMIKDLINLGMWNKNLKDMVIANNGSIQNIEGVPDEIKRLYKTSWELKQKCLMDLSIGRGPYVCQTQSLNLFFEEPTTKMLTSAMFYAWRSGLKTGVYYVRSRPKTQAQQFTIDPSLACSSCSG